MNCMQSLNLRVTDSSRELFHSWLVFHFVVDNHNAFSSRRKQRLYCWVNGKPDKTCAPKSFLCITRLIRLRTNLNKMFEFHEIFCEVFNWKILTNQKQEKRRQNTDARASTKARHEDLVLSSWRTVYAIHLVLHFLSIEKRWKRKHFGEENLSLFDWSYAV